MKNKQIRLQEYWAKQIQTWGEFGGSKAAFCRSRDLDYWQFGYWLRKLGRPSPQPKVDARVLAKPRSTDPVHNSPFFEVRVEPGVVEPMALRVRSLGGVSIEMAGAPDPRWLAALVRGMEVES